MSQWVGRAKFGFGFDPRVHPTQVCKPLADCAQKIRLLNGHDVGGWIGWISGKKVFLDARNDHYSENLLVSYMESRSDPQKFANLLRKHRINAVFVRFDDEPAWVPTLLELNRRSQLTAEDGTKGKLWRCVARDLHTALFFRCDICPDLREVNPPESQFNIPDIGDDRIDAFLIEMANKPSVRWRKFILPTDKFPSEVNLLLARAIEFGEIREAKRYAMYGMQQCEWFFPSLWVNLAYAFELEGDNVHADFCWKTIIRQTEDPQWQKKEKAARKNRQRMRYRENSS